MKHRKALVAKEELVKVPIEEVAKIAATLICDGKTAPGAATTRKRVDEENPLVAATAKAFELLEIACYGKSGLRNEDSYEAGLADFVESKKIDEDFLGALASLSRWEWKHDEHGKKLPVPFEEGLAFLIPKPGVKASQTADRRMARLKAFMTDRYQAARPEQGERERMIEVEARIAAMERDGIPPHLFDQWLVRFPEWWQRKVSETRSDVGQKGQQAKAKRKGRPGRVKSKDDKRLGARLPVLKPPEETLGA